MRAPVLEMIQQDQLAWSLAQALAVANKAARAHGVEPEDSLMTITEEGSLGGARVMRPLWRSRLCGRRGGDVSVLVDEGSGSIQRIVRGQ